MQNKLSVAKTLHDSAILIGTYIEYIKIIDNKCITDQLHDIFDPIRLSLQTSIIIETFKIFDNSGSDARNNNIKYLINTLDSDVSKKYKREYNEMLSDFESSIRNVRNKLVAHNIGVDVREVIYNNPIKMSDYLNFIKFVSKVCFEVDENNTKAVSSKNVQLFDKFMYLALKQYE